jgi:hypothetical protein
MVLAALSAVVSACVGGCAETRQSYTPSAAPAFEYAQYDLQAQGTHLGKAWIGEAALLPHRQWATGKRQPFLGVTLIVDNESRHPLRVPVGALVLRGVAAGDILPTGVNGQSDVPVLEVPAQASRRFDMVFVLPIGMHVRKVKQFTVDWMVLAPRSGVARSTAFVLHNRRTGVTVAHPPPPQPQ